MRNGILLVCLMTSTMLAFEPAAVRKATVKSFDGTPIAYDVRGSGKTTLLFVHCWACERTFWREQVDVFAAKGYQVVTLDLGGHGESGKTRATWSIASLGNDVVAVADALKLKRIVLVGHSMGGPVSLLAAAKLQGRAIGIVAVDTLQNAEQPVPADGIEMVAKQFENDYAGMMKLTVTSMFPPTADPKVRDWVIARGQASEPKATLALIRDFSRLKLPEMYRQAGVPIRAVNAMGGPRSVPTTIEVNRKYADYDATFITGAGHYLHLERPEEFNQKFAAWLTALDR